MSGSLVRLGLLSLAGAVCGALVGALASLLLALYDFVALAGVGAVVGAGLMAATALSARPSPRAVNRQDPPARIEE